MQGTGHQRNWGLLTRSEETRLSQEKGVWLRRNVGSGIGQMVGAEGVLGISLPLSWGCEVVLLLLSVLPTPAILCGSQLNQPRAD